MGTPRNRVGEEPMGDAGRLARLRAAMEREDLDAVALVPGANFYFLTGASFHLMERPTLLVVPREGPLHAVMPLLERSRWQAAAPEAETSYWQDSDGFDGAFARARRAGSRRARIGVEGQRMRVFEAEALRRAFPDAAVVDAHSAISHMRLHKDAGEIEAMRRAIAISEARARRHARRRRRRHERDRVPRGVSSPRCSTPAPTGSPSTRSCSPAPPPPTRTAPRAPTAAWSGASRC